MVQSFFTNLIAPKVNKTRIDRIRIAFYFHSGYMGNTALSKWPSTSKCIGRTRKLVHKSLPSKGRMSSSFTTFEPTSSIAPFGGIASNKIIISHMNSFAIFPSRLAAMAKRDLSPQKHCLYKPNGFNEHKLFISEF